MRNWVIKMLILLLGITLISGCGTSMNTVEENQNGETITEEGGSDMDKSIEKKLDIKKPKLQTPPNLKKVEKEKGEPEWFQTEFELQPGESSLKINYTVENISQKDVVLVFSSGQQYDFEVYNDKNELIYKWSDGKMFTMAIHEKFLASGDQIQFQADWDYRDKDGNIVPDGEYVVRFWVTARAQTEDGQQVAHNELQSSSTVQIKRN